MAIDPCSITQAAQQRLQALGISTADLQNKLDDYAIQANKSFDLLDNPILNNLIQNFNNALSGSVAGVVGELSSALAQKINENVNIIAAVFSVLLILASSGSQIQSLLVSQLKREVSIRIMIFRLLLYHYTNINTILKQIASPTRVSYAKLLAVLPYVKKAEGLFGRVVLAQSTGDLPARYSYAAIRDGFYNIQIAVDLLTSDASSGGKQLGNALEKQFSNNPVGQTKMQSIQQKLAAELIFTSIAKSLSYIETLTWNFTEIAALVPVVYDAGDSIFKTFSYADDFLKNNGATGTGVQKFNKGQAQFAKSQLEAAYLTQVNSKLSKAIADIDIQKGLIPTTVLIDSLMSALINFPNINVYLQGITQDLITFVMPIENTVQNVREGMEQSISQQDADLVLTAKEAVWTSTLNTVLALRNSTLQVLGGQAVLAQDAYTIQTLLNYLINVQGSFVIAENMPKFMLQSLAILRAPFSNRALQEGLVYSTFLVKQLKVAIDQDQRLLDRCAPVAEPLSQFTDLLSAASNMPEPASTIANAIITGQVSQVAGLATAITLGTIAEIKSLFSSNCPQIKSSEDVNLSYETDLRGRVDNFVGTAKPSSVNTTGFPTSSALIPPNL